MDDLFEIETTNNNYLVPASEEVIKNRWFGMPVTKMTRHQRVSFAACVKIAYEELLENPEQQTFSCELNSFLDLIGIDTKKRKRTHLFTKVFTDDNDFEYTDKSIYSLEQTLMSVVGQKLNMRFKDDGRETYKVLETVLVSEFILTRKKVMFAFGPWVRDNILSVGNAYIMSMPSLASLRSTYAVALYEQLEQRRDFRRWEIGVDAFREIMGLYDDTKYKKMADFKKAILARAVNEINEKTNYNLVYTQKKEGRTITKFIFTWSIENDKEDNVFADWKKFIRENFVNIDLLKTKVGGSTNPHVIRVSEKGMLYNGFNPDYVYSNDDAKRIWKYMFENQEKLLIKPRKDDEFNPPVPEKDYSDYYGRNYLFDDDDLYENIVSITTIKNKLKVKFHHGEVMVLTEDELISGVIF